MASHILSIFGAAQLSVAQIYELEKSSPNILVYALPVVLILTLVEFAVSHYAHHNNYETKETLGSILIGAGNLAVNLLMKIVLLYGAVCIYNQLPWRMEFNWWTLIPCYIAYDFCSYWAHRVSHYNRFFWASHVVHHSAEHFNLTVSFRQSWAQHFKIIFFIPVALMGFHPVIFFVANQLGVLYQFWVHTESIGKVHPFIEKYFGTPSNHRVHHGSQAKYLDKNFGATLMIWDHLFNSFQYEDEKPIYGITSKIDSKINPFILNFHEYLDMINDARQAIGLRRKLFFIFASPARIAQYKSSQADPESEPNMQIAKPVGGSSFAQKRHRLACKIILLLCLTLVLESSTVIAKDNDSISFPSPKGKDLLFYLQRDPDANTVIYELNYKKDGSLNDKSPVKASWIRYSEKGQHKELTLIEKKFAYGTEVKKTGDETYEIYIAAYKKQVIYLSRSVTDHKFRAYTLAGDKHMELKRIFVHITGGSFWFPAVKYVELTGNDAVTAQEIIHRIKI